MSQRTRKNIVISALATSLSASAALVPVISSISDAYPDYANWVQLLITIPPLMIMFSSLCVSPLLKYFSEKTIAIAGFILLISSGIYPYFIDSFVLLLISRILVGLGLGLLTTISSSLPASYFPAGQMRDSATGLQAAFNSFGSVLFSFLSGWIATIFWRGVFLVQLLNFIPLFIIIVLMPRKNSKTFNSHEYSETFSSGKIFVKSAWLITILAFICFIFTITFPLNLSLFVASNNIGSTKLTGAISSVNALLGFIIGLLFAKINKALNRFTLPISVILVAISFYILSFFTNISSLFVASTLFGIGTSLIYPSFLNAIFIQISEPEIVSAVGMYTVASNISQFISPFIVNNIAKIFGTNLKFRFLLSAICLTILSGFILINSLTSQKRPAH